MTPLIAWSALFFGVAADERCAALTSDPLRRQLDVAAALSREVVLVPEKLADDDAKALAVALHADIGRVDDRWRIFRSADTSHALRKADGAWTRARIDETASRLDAVAKRCAKSPVEAPFEAMRAARARFEACQGDVPDFSAFQAHEMSPAARLLIDLLRQIPENVLQSALPGTETVFSNAPVGIERSLLASQEALEASADAQRRFAEWADRPLIRESVPANDRWAFPTGAFRPRPRTLLLWIVRREPEPAFSLEIYDSAKRLEARALLSAQRFEIPSRAPTADKARLGKIDLPPQMRAAWDRPTPGSPGFRLGDLDPVVHEPLDRCVRDALIPWAKAKGFERILACVPDALLEAVPRCAEGGRLDLDLLTAALDRADCECLPSGRTLVCRPLHPLQEEALRIDRRPLSALFRDAFQGRLDTARIVAYHAAYADGYDQSLTLRPMERPIRDAFSLGSIPAWGLPHALLAILGGLPLSDRQKLLEGAKVPLDSTAFSPSLLSLVSQVVPQNHTGVPISTGTRPDFSRTRAARGWKDLPGRSTR